MIRTCIRFSHRSGALVGTPRSGFPLRRRRHCRDQLRGGGLGHVLPSYRSKLFIRHSDSRTALGDSLPSGRLSSSPHRDTRSGHTIIGLRTYNNRETQIGDRSELRLRPLRTHTTQRSHHELLNEALPRDACSTPHPHLPHATAQRYGSQPPRLANHTRARELRDWVATDPRSRVVDTR